MHRRPAIIETCEPRRFFAGDPALAGGVFGTPGSFADQGNTIARAFDGSLATYVDMPTRNGPNVMGLDLGSAKSVTAVAFAPRKGYAYRLPGGRFEGSNVADFASGVTPLHTIGAMPAEGTLTRVELPANAGAFRYVRYVAPAGSFGNVAELQFFGTDPNPGTPPPTPTTPGLLTGTVIGTAGSFNNSGNTIAKVFDGSLSTYLDWTQATGAWAGLDLGSAKTVTSIKYAPKAGVAYRMPGGRFEGSTTADFSAGVVTLATIAAMPPDGVLTSVAVNVTTPFRYVRYLPPARSWGNVAEVQFFGSTTAASPLAPAAIRATLSAAKDKLLAYHAKTADKTLYPVDATGGSWVTSNAAGWTSGFYPGALWLAGEATGDAAAFAAARTWTAGLAPRQWATDGHDVGFQIYDSFGQGFRLTGDAAYKAVMLNAARSLSSRFSPTTGLIRSWGNGGGNHQVIVDNLMNLELLMWASKNGGESAVPGWSLAQIATSHADRTLANHVRADGSTFHVVEFDPTTGAALDPTKYAGYKQAYSTTSTWSRGQAWAIYGYTMMYRETGQARFLAAARKTADYFLSKLPADGVPPADFVYGTAGVPYSTANKDATAGAIAASALVELSGLLTTPADRSTYFDAATRLLTPLTTPAYLSLGGDFASLLKHGSRLAAPPNDAGFIYGDYYLIESLSRYLDRVD